MLVAEEGLGRSAFHASGHLDTVVICLLCFDNVVELHRFGCVGFVCLSVVTPLAGSANARQGTL